MSEKNDRIDCGIPAYSRNLLSNAIAEDGYGGEVTRCISIDHVRGLVEGGLLSTVVLQDLIEAAPVSLSPIGKFTAILSGHGELSRADFLRESSHIPRRIRSDVQWAVGDYLASLSVPEAPRFASDSQGPGDTDISRIQVMAGDALLSLALDAISADQLLQLFDAASPAVFGDLKTMETRVDPLVRSGREIGADKFTVSLGLCEWVRRTWAAYFRPVSVRVEPYKINLYAPGDRFVMHRDTPEKNLVGTFLLALSGWGAPCAGGGLVVHDEVGAFHWEGTNGWAAFLPYLPHEVTPIASGARVTLAFKIFATDEDVADEACEFDEALLEEAASRIALCRNDCRQVGVLLKYAYSIDGTALCGGDRFVYRALQRLGNVQSVPVAVHMDSQADDLETEYWRGVANVYALTSDNLARIARRDRPPTNESGEESTRTIPFISVSRGHRIYDNSRDSIEHVGNFAEPANVNTLYVQRALIVTEPTCPVESAPRCAAADFARVDLSGRNLRQADFRSANLSGASLARANLQQACLANADLSKANLRGADLSGADLSCADLTKASLSGACLHNASLEDACLDGIRWDSETIWPDGFEPIKERD